jgi:arylsulfatase A-like enzyme
LQDAKVVEAPAVQHKLTAMYTEEAVKFITVNKDRPFFLYLPHTAVHAPHNPGLQFRGKSSNGIYGDWAEEVDWSVGRVLSTLKELKLDKNTLVLFTSDNGGIRKAASNAPLRGYKGSTWEGGMREPTVAWWPGKIAAGSTCDAMMSEIDLLPTLVKLAGGTVPTVRKIDGIDVWPVLSGQSTESPHEALYYFLWGTLQAVRSGPWKLSIAAQSEGEEKDASNSQAATSRGAPRLYNLDNDIGEKTDVASQHPDVVKRLQALIAKMDQDLGIEKGRKGKVAPGVRPAGHVDNPQPLLMRHPNEYD